MISVQHLNGLFPRQLVLYGIAVRLVDLLGYGKPATPARVVLAGSGTLHAAGQTRII